MKAFYFSRLIRKMKYRFRRYSVHKVVLPFLITAAAGLLIIYVPLWVWYAALIVLVIFGGYIFYRIYL